MKCKSDKAPSDFTKLNQLIQKQLVKFKILIGILNHRFGKFVEA